MSVTTIAQDFRGRLAVSDGMAYYLTPCCGASGKGSAGSYTGVVCRACYVDVDLDYGMGWMVSDEEAWTGYAAAFVAAGMRDHRELPANVREHNRQVLARGAARVREAAIAAGQ